MYLKIRATSNVLKCPSNCDTSCHDCLNHFGNQRVQQFLDRNLGKQLLDCKRCLPIHRLHLFAERYFKSGYYHEAVIYAQISVEVFIRQVYIELLKEADQMTSEEVINVLEETPFMSIIKKKLHNYLGGNWDIKDYNTDISKWHEKTYTLRNQSIHIGRIPSLSETAEAIEAAINFRLFVLERIRDNQRKYPKLATYFSIK